MTRRPTPTIRVDAQSRWDALSLAQLLREKRTYLVQHSPDRWQVCVAVDYDCDVRELTDDVCAIAQRWAELRRIEATVRVGERRIELSGAVSA